MIYTVTFNPALDYAVYLDRFSPGQLNRTAREELSYGGKGINVSVVLRQLGVESVALGFAAGFTGRVLQSWVQELDVRTDFIFLSEGMTRINVKIKADSETEINAQGPKIDAAALQKLLKQLDALTPGDILVLAGSIPSSLPEDIYERLLGRLTGQGVEYVVDATGDLLKKVLRYRPFLIKPNHLELGELCGNALDPGDLDSIVESARRLQELGARNVLVSMSSHGAALIPEQGEPIFRPAAPGKLVNSVGSGDSMVAGFLAGWLSSRDPGYALKLGTAAGSATAFSEGLATREEIEHILKAL